MEIATETNVPHEENISYFGEGHDEAWIGIISNAQNKAATTNTKVVLLAASGQSSGRTQ